MTDQPDQLQAKVAALEAKLREAEAQAAAKDAFIAAMGRELSNPLAPVLLAMERLRHLFGTGDAHRMEAALVLLERAIETFERRTRVLLNLAEMTAGSTLAVAGPVDLTALVSAAGERHGDAARRAGCDLAVEAAPGLVAAAHAESLAQVLDDLLANAFRFGAGRPVCLRAARDEAGVLVSVTDHGPGLGAGEAERVFGLFGRPRGTLEPGFGVGLWVAAQLVSAMGGRIRVESTQGRGAHFHVSLAAPFGATIAPAPQNLQFRAEDQTQTS
jgi:signal transduction histidine kinase